MNGEGKRKLRPKPKAKRKMKARIKIVVHEDRIGKYVIVNGKKFRFGRNVSKKALHKFVTKKILEPTKPGPINVTPNQDQNLKTTAAEESKRDEEINRQIAANTAKLNQEKLIRDIERDKNFREFNEQRQKDELERKTRDLNVKEEQIRNIINKTNRQDLLKLTVKDLWNAVKSKQRDLGHSFGLSRFKKSDLINYIVDTVIPPGVFEPSIPSTTPGHDEATSSRDDVTESEDPLLLDADGSRPLPKALDPSRFYTIDEKLRYLKMINPHIDYSARTEDEINSKFREYQEHGGLGRDRGLSNFQIDKIMSSYPEYLGTISHDEVISRIIPKMKPKSRGGFVINTDPESKPGEHWQAVFWDARPKGENEIDFYDSYGDPIDKSLQKDLLFLAHKLNAGTYLKLKENKIGHQNNRSSNCGWFAVKFLMDRFRGKHFQEASGWDDAIRGEKNIEKFKHQHGGHFGYIPSFQSGKAFSLPELREDYPPAVRKYLVDTPITSIQIARAPISSGVNTILNVVTLGGWQKALSTVGIDKALHLKMVLNGNTTLERNHVVQMYPGGVKGGDQVVNVPLKGPLTFKQLLERTKEQVGPSLQRYDPVSNNCQIFLTQVLKANGLLTPELNSFINQNIEGVFKNSPSFLERVAKTVTDIAHRADTAINGKKLVRRINGKKYGRANLYELQGIINPGST